MFMAFHKSLSRTIVQLHNRDKPKRHFFRKDNKPKKPLERNEVEIQSREERVFNSLFSVAISTGGEMVEIMWAA